ncbi:MAG: zinc ribbon domain-containing protein [bacterium]
MREVLKNKPPAALILVTGLLWASFGWCLPLTASDDEAVTGVEETLPQIECAPEIYASITHDEVLTGLFDIAAAEAAWTCGDCSKENNASAKFCSDCGVKKGGVAGSEKLSGIRMCTQCGAANEKAGKYCGDCGTPLGVAGGGNMVYVPGRGYYAKGTMIESGHARTGLWVSGLLLWLLVGPGIAYAGVGTTSTGLYALGGLITIGGLVMFIVGLASKTKPIYAFRAEEDRNNYTPWPDAPERLRDDEWAWTIDVTCLSF